MKSSKTNQKKKLPKLAILSIVALGAMTTLAIIFFAFSGVAFSGDTFYKGTKINGVDVSGLNKQEASTLVATSINSDKNEIFINLKYNNKNWNFSGKDFASNDEVMPLVDAVYSKTNEGNFFQKRLKFKNLKNNDYSVNISYRSLLSGFDEKLQNIINEINTPTKDAEAIFNPDSKEVFTYNKEVTGVTVNVDLLEDRIDDAFKKSKNISIEIPVLETKPQIFEKDLREITKLRGSYSTGYVKSSQDRKYNVKKALQSFNGMIIQPEQEISFNNITGPRTKANGYKKANIILSGVYVEDYGGGVCQASSTLYNALINSDLEIIKVSRHSLPVGYIPPALDAMVSEGVSDLIFKNNTQNPIYIKTYTTAEKCFVEIYGQSFNEGERVEIQSEFIRVIPHSGDKIIKDTSHQYSKKVTFKGEYLRLKYPMEGYEYKAYKLRYKNDELISKEEIRHSIYEPQEGVIIEGVEDLGAGMTLPENKVKFIPAQQSSKIDNTSASKKIEQQSPSEYNP